MVQRTKKQGENGKFLTESEQEIEKFKKDKGNIWVS